MGKGTEHPAHMRGVFLFLAHGTMQGMADFSAIAERIPWGLLISAGVFTVFWIGVFALLYHLIRFGIGVAPKIASLTLFIGALLLFMIAIAALQNVHLAIAADALTPRFPLPDILTP